jgi:phosphatidylglycerophosphate synthase
MLDEPFRVRFAPLVRPAARRLAGAGVTANHVTVASFVIATAGAAVLASGRPFAGLALWIASRVGDGLDGAMAREAHTDSAFGGYLDITLDMAAYVGMVLGFASLHPDHMFAWLCVLAGYVVVITTTLALSDSARAANRQVSATNRTFQFTAGLTEAGETNVMYTLWVLFPQHIGWLVWVWVLALAVTCVQRTVLARRLLGARGIDGAEGIGQ